MEDSILDSPVDPIGPPDVIIRHISGSLSVLSLIFAVLLILTYGTGAAFRAVRVFFTTFILLFHVLSVLKLFLNSQTQKSFQKSLFLSSDVHYLTLFILFTIADLTPILTIVSYGIGLAAGSLNYLVGDVFPLFGQPATEAIESAQRFSRHWAVTFVPIYLEIALILQLFVIAVADWTLINVFTFVVYIIWIVLFNYATSQPHKQVWESIQTWIGAAVEANRASYGPVVERITGKVAQLGVIALQWYK
jgi:hypothetical protein